MKSEVDRGQVIPERTKINYSISLTPEQAEFVEENHNLIFAYLKKWNLPVDDYYDLAAIGLVKATLAWFQSKYVRQFKFSTVAFNAMGGEYLHYKATMDRHNVPEVDVDELIRNRVFSTKGQDSIDRILDLEVAKQRLRELEDEHRIILICYCNGLKQRQIAKIIGRTQVHVSRSMKRIQEILDRRNKDEMSRL